MNHLSGNIKRLIAATLIGLSSSNLYASEQVVIAVNAGGDTYTAADGTVYSADTGFNSGNTFGIANSISINNTNDPALYRSERYGNFTYNFALPNGAYAVTLHLSEIFFDSDEQRVFDVAAEGNALVNALDLHANAGRYGALDLVLPAEVNDGDLTLEFNSIINNAKLSGIKVVALSSDIQPLGDSYLVSFTGGPQTFDVLENDQGSNLRITGLNTRFNSLQGSVSIIDNQVLYIPPSGGSGFDVFSYNVSNGVNASEDITVFVYDSDTQ